MFNSESLGKKMKKTARLAVLMVLVLLSVAGTGLAEDLFSVTLLGTGSPRPSRHRFGNSTLVEVGGQRLLFDFGRGATIGLFDQGVPIGSINAHFLTHMHSDHIDGLPDLYATGWISTPYGKRTTPFVIYGPKGTKEMMHHIYNTFAEDRRIRSADEKGSYPLAGDDNDIIKAYDIKPGVVFEKDGVKVTAFPVFHGELIEPCFGFKIEYKGHSVVLSGDTKYSKEVEKQATGSDLLIHEVVVVGGDSANAAKIVAATPEYRNIINHHTTPEECGLLFKNARPKLAVYSHIVIPNNPKAGVFPATPLDLINQTRKMYDGPLVVGEDRMTFLVNANGVSMYMSEVNK